MNSRVAMLCVFIALATLASPVVLAPVPPLLDYPNHFARLWLLAGGVLQPPFPAIYAVDWSAASTNIGVDLLAATLGRMIGIGTLGPCLVAAALILPPLGAVLLHRSIFGGWHWWQAGFAILAWNSTLLAGFLSFQIGLGLALLAGAAIPGITRRTGPIGGAVARVALGAGLLIFHVFAAAFYAVILAGLAFGPDRSPLSNRHAFARAALRSATAGGLALGLPLAVFVLVAPIIPGGHAPPGAYSLLAGYTWANKATTLASAVLTYNGWLDTAFIFALWAMARLIADERLLRVHAGLVIVSLGLFALVPVMPSDLGGTAFVDWRLPVMGGFTLIAALRPNMRSPRGATAAALALLLLALTRTTWIGSIWQDRQADVRSVERALAFVPEGASLLPLQNEPADTAKPPVGRYLSVGLPTYWHLVTLAVPWRHAFVPTLFTARGKQPLLVLPPWDSLAAPEGVPTPIGYLELFNPSPVILYTIGYAADWRNRFDYALLVNADLPQADGEHPLPQGLDLVTDEGFARLYRIRRKNEVARDATRVAPAPGQVPAGP
jgi:hypothetical protein